VAPSSQDDVDRSADVCLIGRTVRDQLFGAEDPVGKAMRIANLPFKVVGTLFPKGQSLSGQDQGPHRRHALREAARWRNADSHFMLI
jgi:putative ABC transport system permease protein